jgi:hypothetical protein
MKGAGSLLKGNVPVSAALGCINSIVEERRE